MRIAVVGVTGMVGNVMLKVLAERQIPVVELIPVASERSQGKNISFQGKSYPCIRLEEAVNKDIDVALFSAGGSVSKEWAPQFAANGCYVIDNSSAWRMDPSIKLVVPEINGDQLVKEDLIIANPNCSTIQLVMAVNPLYKAFGIKRLVISTYQSITGTGAKAVMQYDAEKNGRPAREEELAYPYPIFDNCIPHCDIFVEGDYTKEEMKLVNETRKILNDESIKVTATAVRVPVHGGHSESVNIEFDQPYTIEKVRELLSISPGIQIIDDPKSLHYPMPLFAWNKDEVLVGRIRKDFSHENALNMWVVADNLRKGAATNAVQILQHLMNKGFVKMKETLNQ